MDIYGSTLQRAVLVFPFAYQRANIRRPPPNESKRIRMEIRRHLHPILLPTKTFEFFWWMIAVSCRRTFRLWVWLSFVGVLGTIITHTIYIYVSISIYVCLIFN